MLAAPYLPKPEDVDFEKMLSDVRNGPLGFIPKPGSKFNLGKLAIKKDKDKTIPVYFPPKFEKAKPVTYSFDYEEDSAERNYNKLWDSWGTRKKFDVDEFTSNSINLEALPGPYVFSRILVLKQKKMMVHTCKK